MRRRILLGSVMVAVVVLAVGMAAIVLIRGAVRQEAQAELFRQAAVTAARIDLQLAEVELRPGANVAAQLRRYMPEIRRSLATARELGGHDVVEAAIAVGDRPAVALSEDPRLLSLIPESATARDVLSIDVDGTPMLATVHRIQLDRPSVELIVAIGRREPLLPVQALSRSLIVALAAGGILLVGLGVWFARTTGGRLKELEHASQAIAGGNLGARAPVAGHDEITEVAVAFNDMAAQLEDARSRERDFLMSVGHDLRTPLTTIRGYAEALDAGDVIDEDIERVAGVLHSQTDRLSRLVEDFMLLARLEAREFTLRPEPMDVAAHVKEIVESFRDRSDAAFVRLELVTTDAGDVELDPDRIGQICGNLLDNALRYTPEGGLVRVELDRSDDRVVLSVRDSGPGIADEDLPRVFDRLYVAGRYRPIRPEGSGLGLTIVRELVGAMNGTISVRSDDGTVFTVDLPV